LRGATCRAAFCGGYGGAPATAGGARIGRGDF
jgi:hypothetical protein